MPIRSVVATGLSDRRKVGAALPRRRHHDDHLRHRPERRAARLLAQLLRRGSWHRRQQVHQPDQRSPVPDHPQHDDRQDDQHADLQPELPAIFSQNYQNYFWEYDNTGLKLLQLRFYQLPNPVPSGSC
jgi:hypothetical protein